MEGSITDRAQELLKLRDTVGAFYKVLGPLGSSVQFMDLVSVRYGYGVGMTLTGHFGKTVRMSFYLNKIEAHMGTEEDRGTRASSSRHKQILKEVGDYLGNPPAATP